MKSKTNPTQSQRTKSKSYLKAFIVLIGVSFILVLTGCLNGDIELPSFMEEGYRQTDIIPQDRIKETIYLYSKDKIDKNSFQVGVQDFEQDFYRQLNLIKTVTPQFVIEMETELHALYNKSETFSPVKLGESNFLKITLIRLCSFMLEGMTLSNVSIVLEEYYSELNVRTKDYDYDYSLRVAEAIIKVLDNVETSAPTIKELKTVHKALLSVKTPYKRKEIKIGLRNVYR